MLYRFIRQNGKVKHPLMTDTAKELRFVVAIAVLILITKINHIILITKINHGHIFLMVF